MLFMVLISCYLRKSIVAKTNKPNNVAKNTNMYV